MVMSWVSFWLNRGAAPARVGLGVTTVLTMTTLINSVNAALPKISYMKSIDIYLFVCFFMVFGAMVEYACVGYTDKRIQLRKNRFEAMRKLMEEKRLEMAKQMELQLVESREPLLSQSSFNGKSNGYRTPRASRHHREVRSDKYLSIEIFLKYFQYSHLPSHSHSHSPHPSHPPSYSHSQPIQLPLPTLPPPKPPHRIFGMRGSDIDKYSRVIFPIMVSRHPGHQSVLSLTRSVFSSSVSI